MKKCIILYTANYCAKIKNYFCVDDLVSKGVDVEFWDLGPITLNEHLANVETPGLIIRRVENKKEYEVLIKENTNAVFFSFMNYAWYSFIVYRMLSKYNCDIVYCTSGCLPPLSSSKGIKIIARLNAKQLIARIKGRLYRFLLKSKLFKPAKIVLQSCRVATCDYKTSDLTVFVGCNSGDYQGYLSVKSSLNHSDHKIGRYVVYIDQYLPFHNDFTLRGVQHINAETFYRAINLLFARIEKKYGCEVVIAAHPSSLKYEEHDFFCGRKVYYNRTAELINQCIGAITCNSTAISFPVIDKKPILIYTSNDIESRYLFFNTLLFPKLLDLEFVNIDECSEVYFRDVNMHRYEKYKYDYLTTPISEHINNSDIIISILNNNYKKYIYHE
ncbi:hypothetical protein [Segatella copri]|uniref:hypothetical protein n=1 Tax=Segatella copri TaxID=165179 RepID=UPI003F89491D